MSKFLRSFRSAALAAFHRRAFSTIAVTRATAALPSPISPFPSPFSVSDHHRCLSIRAFSTSPNVEKREKKANFGESKEYPSGEAVFKEFGGWKKLAVKLRMLTALPWERVPNGSVLTMKLRGEISDQLKSSYSPGISLPQICENFIKAAYDPRISAIYLHIESLKCGWGKVEEIRRHILEFKKSGKFVVGFAPACGEKEYYLACACEELYVPPSAYFALYGLTVQASFLGGVLEKVGVGAQVQRIGKYKSAGDQLMRKSMSEENREMLTSLLDNIYGNWLDKISLSTEKKKEDIENFINEGVYSVEKLKEDGWITDIKYEDEVMSKLKERLGIPKNSKLPTINYQ